MNDESRLSMWNHYYYVVPNLLNYMVSVIDKIIFSYLPNDIDFRFAKLTKR